MSSRIEKMLAKTQGIRAAKDIPDEEIVRQSGPKTAVGTMAAWQAAQARIQELEAAGSTVTVPIGSIVPNPWQPRRVFDEARLIELATSIREIGLIQPIVVRRKMSVSTTDTANGNVASQDVSSTDTQFQLVAGERRWRATQRLGSSDIKVVIADIPDSDMAAMALAENMDRQDLADFEIAVAIRNAQQAFPNRKQLAEAIGKQRTELYAYLAFFKLPEFIVSDLERDPAYLGRNAAEDVAKIIGTYGIEAETRLRTLWPRLKSGEINQGKLAAIVQSGILRGTAPKTERDIRKLFLGKEQAGSITRDANNFSIKIKTVALSQEKEAELRAFVEKMFS